MCQQIHRDFIFTSFHRVGLTLLGRLGQKTWSDLAWAPGSENNSYLSFGFMWGASKEVPQLSKQKPPNVNDEGGMEDNNGLI